MNKLCRQVSIESPAGFKAAGIKDCVFNFIVPVPDTPANGARIKVVYAGACYSRNRSSSVSSVSSMSSELNDSFFAAVQSLAAAHQQHGGTLPPSAVVQPMSPAHHGYRDGALFPGFEVAGVIDTLGSNLTADCGFTIGQRVVLYPFDEVPNGYAEYIVVPDLKYLIPIPDTLSLSVAAMLPTGALLAMNTVFEAHKIVENILADRGDNATVKIMIVGTGGLALWAVRIAAHHFIRSDNHQRVKITVASLRDEGFMLARDLEKYKHLFQKYKKKSSRIFFLF